MHLLNNRDAKKILRIFEEQWDCALGHLLTAYTLVLTGKDKVYLVNREVHHVSIDVPINSMGLYIASVKDKQIRLTIEGTQLIGPRAAKNVVDIDKDEARQWIRGNDIKKTGDWKGFVIVRNDQDYLGCGHYKDGRISNYVPKTRRIHTAD